ncbi:hypothetical protein D3C85_967160 [compost metagenome]
MTKARLIWPNSLIGMPSHGLTPASSAKSVWRRRKSTFSEPRPLATFCSRTSSSTVECGVASAAMASAPCSCLMFFRPCATYSSAVCQSTSFHSLPCFSIGEVRRSALSSASYEKRSLSEIQHSLTASFSSGSTRLTLPAFTCTIRFEPRPSCGLTDLRRDSSHVRAL